MLQTIITGGTAYWLGPHPACGLTMPALESGSLWSGGRFPDAEDWLVFQADTALGLGPLVIVPVWDRRTLLTLCLSAKSSWTQSEDVRRLHAAARRLRQ